MSNRLTFLVGLNTGFVTDGLPDDRYIDFYQRRSSSALHCAIVGNVVVPGGYGSNAYTPTISSAPVWSRLAAEISARGSLPGIQLATAWEGYHGSRNFRSREGHKSIELARELVRRIPQSQRDEILDAFEEAAGIAIEHGFKHIQIHAAHGYLMSLLVDRRITENSDRTLKRVSALAWRWREEGIETSIRISLRTGDDGFDAVGRESFLATIAALPFDFVDVSTGFYNIDKQLIYPARPDTLRDRRAETVAFAAAFPARGFIFSGRALKTPTEDLPENLHIGLCRDLLANPRYLFEPANGCMNSGKCHYFSRGASHITCPRWTETSGGPLEDT